MKILFAVLGYKPLIDLEAPYTLYLLLRKGLCVKSWGDCFTTNSIWMRIWMFHDQSIDVDGVQVWYFNARNSHEIVSFCSVFVKSSGFICSCHEGATWQNCTFCRRGSHADAIHISAYAQESLRYVATNHFLSSAWSLWSGTVEVSWSEKRIYIKAVERPSWERQQRLLRWRKRKWGAIGIGVQTPAASYLRVDIVDQPQSSERSAPLYLNFRRMRWLSFLWPAYIHQRADRLIRAFLMIQCAFQSQACNAGPDEWAWLKSSVRKSWRQDR